GVATEYLMPGVETTDLTGCPTGTVRARLWTLPAVGGANQAPTMKFCWATFTFTTAFNDPGVSDNHSANVTLLVSVILPDGTAWRFTYDSWGDLSTIATPTGGTISYSWATMTGCDIFKQSRFVIGRSADPNDGSPVQTTSFEYNLGLFNTSNLTTVTDPL